MTDVLTSVLADVRADLRADGDALETHVADPDADGWRTPTSAAGWDAATQVADLVRNDVVAVPPGGTGYMHGTEAERHYRDARILPIGGGATEVLTYRAAKPMGDAR